MERRESDNRIFLHKPVRFLVLSVLLVISVAISAVMCTGCRKKEKDGKESVPIVDVALPLEDSIVVHKGYPATLSASDKADVVAQVNGRIISKKYRSGSYVRKGDVLFVIDPTIYKDEARRAEASLVSARSACDYARQSYEAQQLAYKSQAVAKMDLIKGESSLRQAEAAVSEAEAALHTANVNLSYCTVRAPLSGYISSADFEEGAYISGEGSPVKLASIYDESSFNVVFNVEESEYSDILASNGGMGNDMFRKVPLTFTSDLPHDYVCDLSYSAPSVDTSTGTLTIMGRVTNIDNELKEGMFCTVQFPVASLSKAILVKDASIGTDQLGKYLYVVNDSDRVELRHVTVGELYADSLRVVSAGVNPGEKYVTKALLTVRNGMKINPKITK